MTSDRLSNSWPAVPLIAAAAASWTVTANRMDGMDIGPGTDLGALGWFAVVWVTMMAAMMLPSVAPMAVAYADRARSGAGSSPAASAIETALFTAGYLASWVAAGLLPYALIQGVRGLGLGLLAWDQAGSYVAAGVIAGAALYQLTRAKRICLRHCREPQLLIERWRPGRLGAMRMGIEHGGFCVGCCWALMAALFALGVMSVGWMVLIAGLIAIERLLPRGALASGATVAVLVALALGVAVAPAQVPGLTIPG
jgi:predicted metal-binding membrane protein